MSAERVTARAILLCGQEILLVHRRRGSEAYHVLPGGGIEDDESPIEACRREVREETGLDVPHLRAVEGDDALPRSMHLFSAEVTDPHVRLGGPEASRSTPDNRYELVWVAIEVLAGISLRPDALKAQVIRIVKDRAARSRPAA